jgi:hypothetical protein
MYHTRRLNPKAAPPLWSQEDHEKKHHKRRLKEQAQPQTVDGKNSDGKLVLLKG